MILEYFRCILHASFYGRRNPDSQELVHNNGGILWNMDLEDGLSWCAIKKFFARIFDGYIMDFSDDERYVHYDYFQIDKLGSRKWFRIPVNAVLFFYVVKIDKLRKKVFTDKMNIISIHDEFIFNCSFHAINY